MPTERFSYVPYLFYQSMDEKIKTWTLRFPAKEEPTMEKAFFDWPVVLQYDVKAKYRLISRKSLGHEVFSPDCSLNQLKATRVCIRSANQSFSTPVFTGLGMRSWSLSSTCAEELWVEIVNQSNCSISVRLLFLFCSRIFISMSYENRTNASSFAI